MKSRVFLFVALICALAVALPTQAAPPGEEPALGNDRVTQEQIVNDLSINQIRQAGLRMFTTPFNKLDGLGDGPLNPADTLSPGGRPTLQGNGMFLRLNGLDAQACLDCHSITSAATRPPTLGVGGVGTANNNAIIAPTAIDMEDLNADGVADFNGRFANPPFVFGAGGVELLALEMTLDLQALKDQALAIPGTPVALIAKGVSFGTISADAFGELDTTNVVGVRDDLVVRPFGRKGEFATVREFATGAMQFHMGMQPVEAAGVGEDVDADGDGVVNEILVGELSALSIFMATLDRPETDHLTALASNGLSTFEQIGCAGCHIPSLETDRKDLPLRFPEMQTDPLANVFYEVDLSKSPAKFSTHSNGGLIVPLFSDLKHHDMGEGLAETFALADEETNRQFVTARLWGIADTAPYLHDGRATTLTEAIEMHGGEAQPVRDAFAALGDQEKIELLEFLRSLRTPQQPGGPPSLRPRPIHQNPGPSSQSGPTFFDRR